MENEPIDPFVQLLKLVEDDPVYKRKLVDKLLGTTKSSQTYYSHKAALSVKSIADAMMLDRQDREIRCQDYPRYSPETIRIRLFSGAKFLVGHMDDKEQTYAKWRSDVTIKVIEDADHNPYAIQIRFKGGNIEKEELEFQAHVIKKEDNTKMEFVENTVDSSNKADWKVLLIEVIENSIAEGMDEKDLNLSKEDIEFIRSFEVGMKDFIVRVARHRIKLIYDPENKTKIEPRILIKE